jgi:Zn-dependent peptidase ImmA (M78 family)
VKDDDASLPPDAHRDVVKYSDLLLKKASAYGRFPTPINDLVKAAQLEVARESVLEKVGLADVYRRLPNCLKLAPDKIKRAAEKIIGLLDRGDRAIHLDPTLHKKRQLYVTVHEIAHDFLPHQRKSFDILADSDHELDPATNDQYEREANCFASEVLFQGNGFTLEAADSDLAIKVALELSKKYGPSVYASLRRYVSTHHRPCALLVFDPPVQLVGQGQVMGLRRMIVSPEFYRQFDTQSWPKVSDEQCFFFRNRPPHKFTAPRKREFIDRNGVSRVCSVEAFDSTKQIFFLVVPVTTTVVPRSA